MANYKDWQDPYIDLESGCLRNRFNITQQKRLDVIEASLSVIRAVEFERLPGQPRFDFEHLQIIHKHLFQDIYDWAGTIRQVEICKGSTMFLPKNRIKSGAHYIFNQLAKEQYLKDLQAEQFSSRAGYYLGEINHIHSFRDGNGRTQRVFINQLANINGYHITWQNVERVEMIQASIEADQGRPAHMAHIISANLINRDDIGLLKELNC